MVAASADEGLWLPQASQRETGHTGGDTARKSSSDSFKATSGILTA